MLLATTLSCPRGFYTITSSNAQSNGFSGKGSSDFCFTLATNCTSGGVDHPLLGKAEHVLGGAQDVHSSGYEAPGKSLHLLSVQQDNGHTSSTSLSEPFCP